MVAIKIATAHCARVWLQCRVVGPVRIWWGVKFSIVLRSLCIVLFSLIAMDLELTLFPDYLSEMLVFKAANCSARAFRLVEPFAVRGKLVAMWICSGTSNAL